MGKRRSLCGAELSLERACRSRAEPVAGNHAPRELASRLRVGKFKGMPSPRPGPGVAAGPQSGPSGGFLTAGWGRSFPLFPFSDTEGGPRCGIRRRHRQRKTPDPVAGSSRWNLPSHPPGSRPWPQQIAAGLSFSANCLCLALSTATLGGISASNSSVAWTIGFAWNQRRTRLSWSRLVIASSDMPW
jgi:hypothetical protein